MDEIRKEGFWGGGRDGGWGVMGSGAVDRGCGGGWVVPGLIAVPFL